MAMKASRKGIRLNDARYFQQHPPHPRKKMTILRIFPNSLILPDSSDKSRDTSSIMKPTTNNQKKVVANQPSEEVAAFFYTDSKSSEYSIISEELTTENKEVQTEIEPSVPKIKKCPLPSKKKTTRSKRTQPVHMQDASTIIEVPSIIAISPNTVTPEFSSGREKISKISPEVVTTKEKRDSNSTTEDENSSKNSWWRGSFFKQIFLDFFLQLLGRRDTTKKKSREKMTDKYSVATSTKDRTQKVARVERNESRKRRTKKYLNSYDFTQHRKRTKRCRGDEVIFDLIRLTQDENLRATILEQALRTRRLEEENARFRKKLDEKLTTRQRSSPLY